MMPTILILFRISVQRIHSAVPCLAATAVLACFVLAVGQEPEAKKPGRVPWTTSRIRGTPEPPPPYRIQRAFPNLSFRNPLLLVRAPGSHRLFVAEQEGRIFSFANDQSVEKADLFLDAAAELKGWDPKRVKKVTALYGLVFHPQFEKNRYCYVCYVLEGHERGKELADGTRVSRFRVLDTDPPRCDPASEKVLITWLAGGHNGCDLHFGPDGFLYISTGDATAPNPPDALDTGQDTSDLLSSILRVDVDHEENGKPYAIPKDNPFVNTPGCRPEIWAYGFRNPWRMSFDRVTGDLWVGDVGWELWEMIYRIQKGGNYGWSVMEGRQLVRPESRRGPTPILPPTLEFPHTEAASITGGYVYRGKRFKDLEGVYICGDWVTRKVWGTRFDGDRMVWHKELAKGNERIVAFGEDHEGELYIVHHEEQGTLHQLAPNPAADQSSEFPRRLSETGLFTSVRLQQPSPGVMPFSIQAPAWADHATAERWLALPGESSATFYDEPVPIPGGFFSGQVFFPADGVLAKTISIELESGNPRSRKRLETQILHFDGETWRGYTYEWNDEQTDATLVPASGKDRSLTVIDSQAPGGKRQQTWHFPSRTECITCHNPWAGFTLAFHPHQLQGKQAEADQLQTLEHLNLVVQKQKDRRKRDAKERASAVLADPFDPEMPLEVRARSYLQANCSHCHRFGAGGTADIDLRANIPLKECKIADVRPVQGTFEIPNARIVARGDPYRSVLFYRLAKLGRGRMPHMGSEIVDERGLRLIHDWILSLGPLSERLPQESPEDLAKRQVQSTPDALRLAYAIGEKALPEPAAGKLVELAMARPEAHVRDLFERFVPDERRLRRLGSVIRPENLLALRGGNAERGRELFFRSPGLQCGGCHRKGSEGAALGPDLTDLAKRKSRAEVLESILEPAKSIDPKYVSYLLETTDGQFHTGLLGEKTDREVVLKAAGDKEIRIPAGKVERLVPTAKSLMPELLLRDLTAEQAADLIEFLMSFK
jgi:putative heme-binding domain-containing protein